MMLGRQRSISAGLIAFTLALLFALLLTHVAFPDDPTNPIKCPPGQEEKYGCKWVQHQITGNCMWLPKEAVAWPWVIVSPAGYCPSLEGETPTATATIVPTDTATATDIPTNTATATSTATDVVILTSTATVTTTATATATDPSDPGPSPTFTAEVTLVIDPGTPTATPTASPTITPTATARPPLPTPDPRHRPPKPGGPGNLGYILAGAGAVIAMIAAGGLGLRRFRAGKRS